VVLGEVVVGEWDSVVMALEGLETGELGLCDRGLDAEKRIRCY